MKRLLITIGLVLLPVNAFATDALSPWVQEVLNRADQGISTAAGMSSDPCPSDDEPERDKSHTIQDLVGRANAVIRPYIDVQKQISLQPQFLRQRTACLQSDMNLLEKKLNTIQQEATSAIETCNSARLAVLLQDYKFTADAEISLVSGGIDPGFEDDRLRYHYAFTDAAMWTAAEDGTGNLYEPMDGTDAEDQPLCPYTTDYSPRSIAYAATSGGVTSDVKSYGCDLTVMQGFGDSDEQAETGPLTSFLYETGNFATSLSDMITAFDNSMNTAIRTLRGLPSVTPVGGGGSGGVPEHAVQTGCQKPAYIEPLSLPSKDILLNAFPDYFASTTEVPGQTLPVGMLLMPSFDYFSVNSNPFMVLDAYIERRNDQGKNRPDDPDNQFNGTDYYTFVANIKSQLERQRRSADIERQSGQVDAMGRDSVERTEDAFSPLTVAVNLLADTVHGPAVPGVVASSSTFTEPIGVLPRYISSLTYFLARECVDGHCQGTLDTINKRVYNPYCTPYISGAYVDDTTYAKCFCIQKDGDNPNGLDIGGADKEFYEDYCLGTIKSADQAKYDAMEPKLYPACQVNGTNM